MRGKGDKFSNKMYRLPVGDASTQVHVENALYLHSATGKRVVVNGSDHGTLMKIAWALFNHKVQGVVINDVPPTGKLSVLGPVCSTDYTDSIMFSYGLTTLASPQSSKTASDEELYAGIWKGHFKHFNAMPIGTASVVKSYYFPPIDGVEYIRSSEPHNGSVIAYKKSNIPGGQSIDLRSMWERSKGWVDECIRMSFNKTLFTLCREKTQWQSSYRIPLRTEAKVTALSQLLSEEDGDTGSTMDLLVDDLTKRIPSPDFDFGKPKGVVNIVTTVTTTTMTTTTAAIGLNVSGSINGNSSMTVQSLMPVGGQIPVIVQEVHPQQSHKDAVAEAAQSMDTITDND